MSSKALGFELSRVVCMHTAYTAALPSSSCIVLDCMWVLFVLEVRDLIGVCVFCATFTCSACYLWCILVFFFCCFFG